MDDTYEETLPEYEEEETNLTEDQKMQAKHGGDRVTYNRLNSPSKRRMRNLTQYRNLTDEQFDEKMARKEIGIKDNREFEGRIQRKIKEFGVDYDLDDLNSNDKLVLRALAQAMINLEDLETQSYSLRSDGIDLDNILMIEKLSKVMSDLRSDISKLQDDLKITRRIRKSDKEQSVLNYLEDLKKKAKEFYESRMFYIFCPKCNMLLSTMWFLYPEGKNKVKLTCYREMEGGERCGTIVDVLSKELYEKRGTNKVDILPESML